MVYKLSFRPIYIDLQTAPLAAAKMPPWSGLVITQCSMLNQILKCLSYGY